ncbi:MAG: RnfABCDGE type electron transport complex subunit D [Treponema sp.]|nr:RnfABCDGE type electron transport complex subunit D [Treponema sp.]MCL2237683.1 RnfABCDGE type electron transport complex subunit D [Treponema sp.]
MKIVINQMVTVSSPPHMYGTDTIEKRMRDVLIALFPAFCFAIYHYGIGALSTMAVAVGSALLAEYLYQRIMGKPVTVNDFSAAITGLLLAFNLPPDVPFWIPIIGSFFAIIVVKQLFGGLGSNFINPALAARAFLLASFPVYMVGWRFAESPDIVTSATYLAAIKANPSFTPEFSDYMALLFGKVGGCVGETSAVALFIGGIYLLVRRIINWRIPVFYIGSFAVFAFIFGRTGLFHGRDILFEVLNGGLIMGAFFMATDYATSPITPHGKIVFGIGCGFLTVFIRFFSAYPEGVSYAIIIMNLFVPLIDKYIRPRVYGHSITKKRKKA